MSTAKEQAHTPGPWRINCRVCGAEGVGLIPDHPRVPKPLREVRDELIEWLRLQAHFWVVDYRIGPNRALVSLSLRGEMPYPHTVEVKFTLIRDEAIALALGAVRLMEKQDANTE